jgi:hypothetical protein
MTVRHNAAESRYELDTEHGLAVAVYREQGDRACGKDAQRLCRNVLNQGDTAVLQCFQSNKNKLSPPCAKFLRDVGQLQ